MFVLDSHTPFFGPNDMSEFPPVAYGPISVVAWACASLFVRSGLQSLGEKSSPVNTLLNLSVSIVTGYVLLLLFTDAKPGIPDGYFACAS